MIINLFQARVADADGQPRTSQAIQQDQAIEVQFLGIWCCLILPASIAPFPPLVFSAAIIFL